MAKDILFEDNDLKFENGDLSIGDSDQQHIEDLLLANKGDYKQSPIVGIGIKKWINSA